jgi:CheY-like chemotaxis protein
LEMKHYDVIFMDVQMPAMDELEATRIIRQKYADREFPRIVALTANEEREVCLAAGMNDHLMKPVKIGELKRVLETV